MTELTPELLARHDGWLRALIRRLVDDGQADDVVQEVWGRALQSPPRDLVALPAWLATVARRVVSRRARTDRRRAARERQVARVAEAEGVDPAELVARVEERQRVARAVLDLDEPFRTVVLLRYFEEVDTATIAARLGVPVATVRTRLHRAHEKLRQRFERERGSDWRGQLALLCLPLGAGEAAPAAPIAGSKLAAIAALPLLLAVGIWWATREGRVEAPVIPPPEASRAADRTARARNGAERAPVVVTAEEDGAPVEPRVPPAPVGAIAIAGELLDFAGHPIPRAPILLRSRAGRDTPPIHVGVTDLRGRFAVTVPETAGRLIAGGDWVTLRAWVPLAASVLTAADDALIVAAPRIRVAGSVVDAAGEPVAGERVEVGFFDVHGFPYPTAGTELESPATRATTGEDGSFVLDGVPGFPYGDLRVGIFRAVVPVPARDTDDLVVVLGTGRMPAPQRTEPSTRRPVRIEGAVRDTAARPVPGAIVVVPGVPNAVETDDHGAFAIVTMAASDAPVSLVVGAPGFGPQQRDVWPRGDARSVRVDVVLRDGERSVTGRVVDDRGRPQPGLVVALADATAFETSSFVTRFAERPDGHAFGAHDRTNASGEFRIPGVLPRAYRLRILDVDSGLAMTTGPVEPEVATDVEVPSARTRAPFVVRVTGRDGRAVEGADVGISVVQLHVESDGSWGGNASSTSFLLTESGGPTDAEGRCVFETAPAGELRIRASKPGWIPVEHDLSAGVGTAAALTLLRQCPIRVEVPDLSHRHLELLLFDASGRELEIRPAWRGDRRPTGWSFGVVRGRSVVAGVAESVARAELRELVGDELVRSMPVFADPERVTVLDFPGR